MLKVQRRHRPPCKKYQWDQGCTRCTCRIVIRGTLSGKHISLSTARYLQPKQGRDFEAARELALLWQRSGKPVRQEAYAPIPDAAASPETAPSP